MTISEIDIDVPPGLGRPLRRDLLHPDRRHWTPTELRDLTATVAADLTAPLLAMLRYDRAQRWWTRLALTEGVELWLLSWLPNQGTGAHDHGGAAGAFTVLLGSLTEHYRYPGGSIGVRDHAVGQAIGFGAHRAHQVRNLGSTAAASVHAYSPPLVPTREYASLYDAPPAIVSLTSARADLSHTERAAS